MPCLVFTSWSTLMKKSASLLCFHTLLLSTLGLSFLNIKIWIPLSKACEPKKPLICNPVSKDRCLQPCFRNLQECQCFNRAQIQNPMIAHANEVFECINGRVHTKLVTYCTTITSFVQSEKLLPFWKSDLKCQFQHLGNNTTIHLYSVKQHKSTSSV